MKVFRTADDMRAWSFAQRATGRRIGFVPTMGALHRGHESLMLAAADRDDAPVLSIFVNPTQFAPHEDFDAYPRTWDTDIAMAEAAGVEAVYAPKASAMYAPDYGTYVTVEGVSEGLCGGSRPHFFRGVATVVTKLFNAVLPHRAYFGQKDAQQCAVIKRMVRDLDMGIEIVEMPIVREEDGLAMSSRNQYLTPVDRRQGRLLSEALFRAVEALEAGERDAATILRGIRETMALLDIDYTAVVDGETMEPVTEIEKEVLVAVAAQVGAARLIDNVKFNPQTDTRDVAAVLAKGDQSCA